MNKHLIEGYREVRKRTNKRTMPLIPSIGQRNKSTKVRDTKALWNAVGNETSGTMATR